MTCGLLDLACHAQVALDGLLSWSLSWLSLNLLIGVWIGTILGAWLGWPAVIAMTLGLASFLNRGRNSGHASHDTEHVSGKSPDAATSVTRETRKPRKQRTILEWWRDR